MNEERALSLVHEAWARLCTGCRTPLCALDPPLPLEVKILRELQRGAEAEVYESHLGRYFTFGREVEE